MPSPNPPNEQENAVMLISYKTLRTMIGLLGMFMSAILVLGMWLIGKEPYVQSSISHFYHTRMGDVFVGFLTAISLFLFVYKGPEKRDNWLGHVAGVLGLIVAFCPTVYHGNGTIAGCMFNRAPYNPAWTQILHLYSAGLFVLSLTVFCTWLFPKTHPGTTVARGTRKWKRNIVYYICGTIMALCIVALAICFATMSDEQIQDSLVVFAFETIALFFFGISWLVKGEQFILKDR